tara:strand:- start:240 stop:1031 length:792 start_codon:yes stop_codon:yes gene_type:complete
MAETLTVNTDDSTPELTSEEQDSLQVGEKMAEEQGELLAGKYKNAEDLEKAYVELQKKLGEKDDGLQEGQETEEVTDKTEEETTSEKSEAVSLLEAANEEFYANDKSISKETLEKFSQLSSQELVQAYIEMQKNAPQTEAEVDVTTSEINKIQNSVGGEAQYDKLISWAGENLKADEIKAFDALVGTGNAASIQLGVDALKAKYDNANGYEGRMLSGKAAENSGDIFKSQAQLVKAISDPRYDNDPAYRQEIVAKLDRSDIQF